MISAYWLFLIAPMSIIFGALLMGVWAADATESIKAATCDCCHWARTLGRGELEEKMREMPVE